MRRIRKTAALVATMPLLIGFTMMRGSDTPQPATIASASAPQRFAHSAKSPAATKETHPPVAKGLPSLSEDLPEMGSPEMTRRLRKLGLDPGEVLQFAKMASDTE